MKGRPMTDDEFWAIVDSAAFHTRWWGRAHPLRKECGGVAYHNLDTLGTLLEMAVRDYETSPKVGMSAWARKNRIAVIRDRMKQVEWVHDHAYICAMPVNRD